MPEYIPKIIEKEREASLSIATGFQGTGKSYQTLHNIVRYLNFHPQRKVLIYDINGEFGYETCRSHGVDIDIKRIEPSKEAIAKFTGHATERIKRITPINKDGEKMSISEMKDLLDMILRTFKRGFLLIEDMNKYLLQVRHIEQIVSSLISLRHQNLDVMIHLQSLSKIDPTLWENTKFLRMHYQTDTIDRIESRVPNFKLIKIAKFIVDDKYYQGNKNFYLWCYLQQNKLVGAFSMRDFKLAYYRYLKSEKRELADQMALMNLTKLEEMPIAFEQLFKRAIHIYGNEK